MFLKISQNSQENSARGLQFYYKRDWHRCLPVKFVKFSRTPFFTEHLLTTVSNHRTVCRGFVYDYSTTNGKNNFYEKKYTEGFQKVLMPKKI